MLEATRTGRNYSIFINNSITSKQESDRRIQKNILVGLLYKLNPTNKDYNPFVKSQNVNDIPYAFKGNFKLRIGALSLILGPNGFDADDSYYSLCYNNGEPLHSFEERIFTTSISEYPILEQMELVSCFPKAAIRSCYELLYYIFINNTENNIYPDTSPEWGILIEYFNIHSNGFNSLAPCPSNETINPYYYWVRDVLKISKMPFCTQVAYDGLHARKADAIIKNNEVTGVEDLMHPQFSAIVESDISLSKTFFNPKVAEREIWKSENFGWDLTNNIPSISSLDNMEMVLLDAGFWGHYDRDAPCRDFGIVEGINIFLCQLIYDDDDIKKVHGETIYRLRSKFLSISVTEQIVNKLYEDWGYTIEIISHALVPKIPSQQDILLKACTIFFPDMHLPEKWPDIPTENAYSIESPSENSRANLRALLWNVQTNPNACNDIDENCFLNVQEYYSKVLSGTAGGAKFKNPMDEVSFTSEQFKREYELVERRIRIDNSWFYPPVGDQSVEADKETRMRSAIAPEELRGDPSPAIDLAALLRVISCLKNGSHFDIEVIQVGDLYEMWMGKEWLYKDYPKYNEVSFDNFIDEKIDEYPADLITLGITGWFQYRLGANWKSYSGFVEWDTSHFMYEDIYGNRMYVPVQEIPDDIHPLYVYHEWPRQFMVTRHLTGSSVAGFTNAGNKRNLADFQNISLGKGLAIDPHSEIKFSIYTRARSEVISRIDAIKNFSLPWPGQFEYNTQDARNTALSKLYETYWEQTNNTGQLKYRRTNAEGSYEFLWNKLLLDLFEEIGCVMVNGNHDGYRGDPSLRGTPDQDPWGAVSFYSNNGFWVEHSHRWDEFNQDGRGFGAAVTNLGHYHMRPAIQNKDRQKSEFIPSFHTKVLPACAQWYLLVNGTDDIPFQYQPYVEGDSLTVQPFSVYCIGHSHTADLVTIRFKREES